jgi:3-methyl-2-oxobutanoate hydroxymethyltransferase
MSSFKTTPQTIREMKPRGQKIAALTAYDYPLAKMLDEAGIPFLLVGDSLGMVVLGYPDTTFVTMADMEHHVCAVARAKPRALVVADLPIGTYDTEAEAVANSRQLITAGADAIKAEGGREILPQVEAIIAAGIPYCGHLGMLPQHVREEGGYKIKGRTETERDALIADALALEKAGAFAVVLEIVTPPVAKEVTASLTIPTIGIGSGPDCDGQILVTFDLVGLFPWFTPKFVKPRANCAADIKSAVVAWKDALTTGTRQ